MTKIKRISFALAFLALSLATVLGVRSKPDCGTEARYSAELTGEESGVISLITDGKSDYKIVFSSDALEEDYKLASDVQMLFAERGVFTVDIFADTVPSSYSEREILLGMTNRQESEDLLALLEDACKSSDDLAWGYAVVGEKVLYIANSSVAFEYGREEFTELLTSGGMTLDGDLCTVRSKPLLEYEEEKRIEAEAARAERIEWLKNEIASFDDAAFGERTPMPTDLYASPEMYPTEGQHPRVNVTEGMLPALREILTNPLYKELSEDFYEYANYDEDGILPPVSTLKVTYNWDGEVLARIEAKALMYLLTGDELYGYEAIYAMKNHMFTLDISHDLFTDLLRPYGWSMMVAGEVYDWCYDLMTESDKSQFVRGVQKFYCEDCPCTQHDKMTIGFPPTGQNAVQGHGTNVSLQRDYLAFAIAIFDEYPDWWELVGGRFYEQYVPANNIFYASGMNTQGTNCYVWGKYYAQLYSAWLIEVMCGVMPYDSGIEDIAYGLMGLRLPNGRVFQSGDGDANQYGAAQNGYNYDMYNAICIAMALFPSEILQVNARLMTNNYTYYTTHEVANYITPATMLIFRANGFETEPEGEKNDGLDLVFYYGSPMGLITARDSWDEDAAAVYMKIGEVTGANHDHNDSGTFQIYYKGCFTSESGLYANYGSSHHLYWHQATIAHNGILVYNPALSGTESGWYSGGQEAHAGVSNYEDWLTSEHTRMGYLTGASSYVDPITGEVEYAYIAGDITDAYSYKTVDTLERRMLAVYTSDPDFPMFFAVYDYVVSKDASFKKSFLLHTVNEPVLDGNTATLVQGEGKIVLTTLTEDAVMTKYGGEGKTFWINDEVGCLNLIGNVKPSDRDTASVLHDGKLWGRVQVDTSGKLVDHMLNVIYVTDADNEKTLTPTKLETDKIIGFEMADVVSVFFKTVDKNRAETTFETSGKGLKRYYISGLSEGSWTLKVDGISVGRAYTSAESGIVDFVAPAGVVTLVPGSDVRPTNSDDIKYYTFGTPMPDDAPYFYIHDEPRELPVLESTETKKFVGWYTSEKYEGKPITAIPVGTRGTIKLYARFEMLYIENYEGADFSVVNTNKTINDFIYQAATKAGAQFKTETEDGDTYLLWQCGTADPQFDLKVPMSTFLAGRTSVTFKLDIALDGDKPAIGSYFRLRGETSKNTTSAFTVTSKGEVLLGGSTSHKIMDLDNTFKTLTVTVDFAEEQLIAFDESGKIITRRNLTLADADKHLDGIGYLNTLVYIYDWYAPPQAGADHALRIDNIYIQPGYPENSEIADPSDPSAIVYSNMQDGILPSDAPRRYSDTEVTVLPTSVVSPSGYLFLGWYSDPELTNRITEIPAGISGAVSVYASWTKIIKESFDNKNISANDKTLQVENGITYQSVTKAGASFVTVGSDEGGKYLLWTKGSADPQMFMEGSLVNVLGSSTAVTYSVRLAIPAGATAPTTTFRVQETGSKNIPVFSTSTDGGVYLGGNSGYKICTLSEEFVTVTVCVDFAAGTVTAYNTDGTVAVSPDGKALILPITKPSTSEAKDLVDFISYTNYAFLWYCGAGSASSTLCIDDLTVTAGLAVGIPDDTESTDVIYVGASGNDLPTKYDPSTDTALIAPEGMAGKIFAGWYRDSAYTEMIDFIPEGTSGTVVLYARWLAVALEDYESIEINHTNPGGTVGAAFNLAEGPLTYYASGKAGVEYRTETDGQGNTYLVFKKGAADPQINKDGALYDFLGTEKSMTLSLDLARHGDAPVLGFAILLRKSGADNITIFTCNGEGDIYLGSRGAGLKIGTLTDTLLTFTVSFDFNTGVLRAIDKDGNTVTAENGEKCELTLSVPSASSATSFTEWLTTLSNYNFVLYTGSGASQDASVRIDNVKLIGGII